MREFEVHSACRILPDEFTVLKPRLIHLGYNLLLGRIFFPDRSSISKDNSRPFIILGDAVREEFLRFTPELDAITTVLTKTSNQGPVSRKPGKLGAFKTTFSLSAAAEMCIRLRRLV